QHEHLHGKQQRSVYAAGVRGGAMIPIVTGGSGSGKPAYAVEQLVKFSGDRRIYIAKMYPFDEESRRSVAHQRGMSAGKRFETVECYTHLENLEIPAGADVLLECMSNLTANEMYREDGAGDQTCGAVCRGISALAERAGNLVVVTNEVF